MGPSGNITVTQRCNDGSVGLAPQWGRAFMAFFSHPPVSEFLGRILPWSDAFLPAISVQGHDSSERPPEMPPTNHEGWVTVPTWLGGKIAPTVPKGMEPGLSHRQNCRLF